MQENEDLIKALAAKFDEVLQLKKEERKATLEAIFKFHGIGKRTAKQKRQRIFLSAYAETGNLSEAARQTKISRQAHYVWLEEAKENEEDHYDLAFEECDEIAIDALEMEARRRSMEGVNEPVFYKGVMCGVVRKYSDTLLIVLLKAKRPDIYKDRVEQHHKGSITQKHEYSYMTDEELEKELSQYEDSD